MKFLNDMVWFFYILGGRGSGGTLNNVFSMGFIGFGMEG